MTKDRLHDLLKFVDHNRYAVIGFMLAMILAAVMVGCQPMTASTLTPGEKITADGLAREVALSEADFATQQASIEAQVTSLNAKIAAYNAIATAAESDLARQIEMRTQIIQMIGQAGVLAAEGALTPATVGGAAVQLLTALTAGGLLLDNRRKDGVIDKVKAGQA